MISRSSGAPGSGEFRGISFRWLRTYRSSLDLILPSVLEATLTPGSRVMDKTGQDREALDLCGALSLGQQVSPTLLNNCEGHSAPCCGPREAASEAVDGGLGSMHQVGPNRERDESGVDHEEYGHRYANLATSRARCQG